MSRTWENLPSECWATIFSHIQQPIHLQPLSLVSKSFLSLTNALYSSLTIHDPTAHILPNLFHRFPNLRHIQLKTTKAVPLDTLISTIARSHIRLQSLDLSGQDQIPVSTIRDLGRKMDPTLRILSCRNLQFLQDTDLIVVACSFPSLQVLDIAYPQHDLTPGYDLSPRTVTDVGIAELSSKLRNLRSIDVSGNSFISDNSLIAIAHNCKLISEIRACDCIFVTPQGVRAVLQLCIYLLSLSVNKRSIPESLDGCVARNLSSLELSCASISDEWLFSLARAALPLQKFALFRCKGFTFAGISALLSSYRSLQQLDIEGSDFLSDTLMLELFEYLRCLISINLNSCPRLRDSTFFNLVRSCRSLEKISMANTGFGVEDSALDFIENPGIRIVKLAGNKSLSDEALKRLASVCWGLRSLDVSNCWSITETGITEIGRRCSEITELKVNGCGRVQNLGMGACFPKLEVLKAGASGMNDEGLTMMGKQQQECRGCLRVLDLEGCLLVTERGIKELLRSNRCKGLKEVNLKRCSNVNANVLSWMVFSVPSLKRIVPPADYIPTERQQEVFLRHGCMVGG